MSNVTSMEQQGKAYIYSNVNAGLLYVETPEPLESYRIYDAEGKEVDCPKLISKPIYLRGYIRGIIDAAQLKVWLEKINAEGFRLEDRMNHIWEEDKLPVERVLFWEDLNVNLAAIKQ